MYMKRKDAIYRIVFVILVFFTIGFVGYTIGGVFLDDNQIIVEPDEILVAGDGHSLYTKTWKHRDVGYEPSFEYWWRITLLIICLVVTFIITDNEMMRKEINWDFIEMLKDLDTELFN